jgi:SP family general alpha glucoside:H+ symporter-like MFS transporter
MESKHTLDTHSYLAVLSRFGRATIYMGGASLMFVCLIVIGGLGCVTPTDSTSLAIGVMLVISTLINMITIGPACYPIVAETPSGRLRYKTIVIGRFAYNLTGIFSNSVTPLMIQPAAAGGWGWGAKAGFFYAGTNLLCNIWCWFRLPESKVSERSHFVQRWRNVHKLGADSN